MNNLPWKLLYTKQGLKDKKTAETGGFREKIRELTALLKENPYVSYPPYEKLLGDLNGLYSRRINRQHRLVYEIYEDEHTIKIISMWEHYE